MAAAGATAAGAQSAATWPVAGGWGGGTVGSRRCGCRLEKANSSSTHCHAVICECGDGGGGTGGGAAARRVLVRREQGPGEPVQTMCECMHARTRGFGGRACLCARVCNNNTRQAGCACVPQDLYIYVKVYNLVVYCCV